MREEILTIIEEAGIPLDASMIHRRLKKEVNLSTVYRGLEALLKEAEVNAVFFFDGTRYYYSRDKHGHFLLCRQCHEVREFEQCAVQGLQERLVEETRYLIENHVVLFSGLCPDCARVLHKKNIRPYFNTKREGVK